MGREMGRGPTDVVAPTVLWDTDGEGARHVRWYADQIAGSELVIFPSEGHLDVCDLHWPEVLAGVLRVWAEDPSPADRSSTATYP